MKNSWFAVLLGLVPVLSFEIAQAEVTAGWENVCAERREYPPTRILWRAKLTDAGGFRLRKIAGAEGTFAIRNGEIEIRKTNDVGLLALEAPAVALAKGAKLRIEAEVHVDSCDLEHSHGCLRVRDARGDYPNFHELTPANCGDATVTSGPELARGLNESPPGMYALKYGQWIVQEPKTVIAIVITGRPSVTHWRNLLAEDYDAAQEQWQTTWAERKAKDHAAEMMDEAEFDRLMAADPVDHVAELRMVNGVTSLYIDGEVAPPVAYKGKHSFAADALQETFCGGRLAKVGVPLMVRNLNLGTGVDPRRYWHKDRFDAKGAVRDLKNAMRLAPEALFMIGLSCNANPEFTNVDHPDQAWITAKGEKLMGRAGTVDDTDDMGIRDNRRWPWVSMASPIWRDAIKRCIRELIAELKAQGLSKRIVGLHLNGFADGQFYPPTSDHSPMAKQRYLSWCAEGNHVSTNYWFYCKNLGMDAQSAFAREFKRALGKPAVAVRWCNCEFIGSQDITEFLNGSDLDVIVAQPAYTRRQPGIPHGPNLPFSSFARHGKMFWMEFDFRTYAALDTWAVSAVAAKGDGELIDLPMWQSGFRKYAGLQLATRSGWWFYDMGGGWWDRPELAADIGSVVKIAKELAAVRPSLWRPSVAVVYDEKGLVGWDGGIRPQNNFSHLLFPYQQRRYAAAGVPYEFFLADEAMKHPEILKDARMIVLANFRKLDDERVRFFRRLSTGGRTLVFQAETGVLGGAEAGTTFRTEYDFADRPHEIVSQTSDYDMLSMNEVCELRELEKGRWPVAPAMGPRGTVVPGPGIRILSTFREDGKPACVIREGADCRRIYCCEPSGISPQMFLKLAREAGAYVPVTATGLQVDMNGDFVSVHALRNGRWTFALPRRCSVLNLKSGKFEQVQSGSLAMELTAGEVCWFRLLADGSAITLDCRRPDGRPFENAIEGLVSVRRELMAARGENPNAKIELTATGNPIVDREILKYARACSNVVAKGVGPEASRKCSKCSACAPRTRVMEYHGTRGTDWWTERLQLKRDQILRQPNREFDVVMLGDSITHFFEWPYFSAAYDRFVWKYRTLNLGYGGDRTENVIWRCENGELDGYRTQYVTLMIGTNNPDPPQDVAAGIRRILELIAEKQPQATVVLMPIFPRGKGPTDPARIKNEKVNEIIRNFADGKQVVWLDFNRQLMNAEGDVIDFFGGDRLHPNERGYRIWLDALSQTLHR